jgi:hypothetical protein
VPDVWAYREVDMSFPSRPPSLISDRKMAVMNHPFLAWLAGLEKEISYQSYGSDIFLSVTASKRFQIGFDRFGQIVVAVNSIDRSGFSSIKWIGAGLIINAMKPNTTEEKDWFLLVADINSSSPQTTGVEVERLAKSIFSLWLPANYELLGRLIEHSKKLKNANLLGPKVLRLISVPDVAPEPEEHSADIACVPLVVSTGGQCVVPSSLLAANAKPVMAKLNLEGEYQGKELSEPKKEGKNGFKGKKKSGGTRKSKTK